MTTQQHAPGHFDGDGCVFLTEGHFAAPTLHTVCPECRNNKHSNCTHVADYETDDTPIDCKCGCLHSRTCPSCADVVPEGWSLDDHLNCNWPEDHPTPPAPEPTQPLPGGSMFGAVLAGQQRLSERRHRQ